MNIYCNQLTQAKYWSE